MKQKPNYLLFSIYEVESHSQAIEIIHFLVCINLILFYLPLRVSKESCLTIDICQHVLAAQRRRRVSGGPARSGWSACWWTRSGAPAGSGAAHTSCAPRASRDRDTTQPTRRPHPTPITATIARLRILLKLL